MTNDELIEVVSIVRSYILPLAVAAFFVNLLWFMSNRMQDGTLKESFARASDSVKTLIGTVLPAKEREARQKKQREPECASVSLAGGKRRVGDVKAAYGGLLSDLVYRIENPALFDSKVPATKEFELLLMRWDDEEKGLSPETAARLAGELELAFAAARKNAETLGIRHLPRTARKNGQKAAHAARLAQHATTTGEREAAMATVIRLLDALALYYMPTPHDIPKMLTGTGK